MSKVKHPNGYIGSIIHGCGLSIYDSDGRTSIHTDCVTAMTEEELYAVLDKMPKIMEVLTKQEKQKNKEIIDLISKEDALDILDDLQHDYEYGIDSYAEHREKMLKLPSEPVLPKDKWKGYGCIMDIGDADAKYLSKLQNGYDSGQFYCANCGVYMAGENK